MLEARDRVGGRVEQQVLDDGRIVQLGGEVVGGAHTSYLGLVAELGLTLVPSYVAEPGEIVRATPEDVSVGDPPSWFGSGDWAVHEAVTMEFTTLATSVDPDNPWVHPDAIKLDAISVGAWLRTNGATPAVIRLWEIGQLSLSSGSYERTSMLAALRKNAAVPSESHYSTDDWEGLRVAEGSATVALRMAADLGQRVRLGSPVAAVHIGPTSTVRLTTGETFTAHAVVSALPVGPLRDVHITGVSDARLDSLHRQRNARAAKVAAVYDRPFWRDLGRNGLSESEGVLGSTWPQGYGILSALIPPERLSVLTGIPAHLRQHEALSEIARMYGDAGDVAVRVLSAPLGHRSLHPGVRHAVDPGRRHGRRAAARDARAAVLRLRFGSVGRRIHGRRGTHRARHRGGGAGTMRFLNHINGTDVAAQSGATLDIIDPSTGEVYGTSPNSGASDVDDACQAALTALGSWRRTTPSQRARALLKLADAMEARASDLTSAEVTDTGKPIAAFRDDELEPIIDVVRFFAGAARSMTGSATGVYAPGFTSMLRREPIGVCAQITPWNYPLMMAVWKIAPALAAGNTVVLKPADTTPASAVLLAQIAAEHLPPGVFNVVCGDRDAGRALVEHPTPRMIAVTGSVRAGREIAAAAAADLKRTHLELGGNAPVLIFDDVDIAATAETLAGIAYYNAGQDCTAPTRLLVQDKVHDLFVREFARAASALRTGAPAESGIAFGPLNNQIQFDAVRATVAALPPHAYDRLRRIRAGPARLLPRKRPSSPACVRATRSCSVRRSDRS